MKQIIFDSFSVSDQFDYCKEHWCEYGYHEMPDDDSLWDLAYTVVWDDYKNVIALICKESFDVLVFGTLGLWNGKFEADKITDTETAFSCLYDDLKIVYEAGDIWVYQYHHDGCNAFRVRGIKDYWDVPEENREELYQFLHYRDPIPSDIDNFTFSLVDYFKEFLSVDSLKDYEENCGSKEVFCC